MNLHILNQAPDKTSVIQDMLIALSPEDAIILIEDGVIAALQPPFNGQSETDTPVFALKADLLARGLTERLSKTITIIDDAEFVELCCKYSKTISWF
ncbi:MAG: sulfurtransferase complex subunit TusB [Neptuniibacter sp.]